MRTDQRPRASRSIAIVVALVLGSVLTLATAGTATGSKSSAATEAVTFTKAWTNDDGRVDGPDVGDVGNTSLIFDMWGRRSSDDPPAAGFRIDRLDKDVARCKAWIPDRAPSRANVRIRNAYPGYVCTVKVKLTNFAAFPVEVGLPVVTADSGLTISRVGGSSLPRTLLPGESVKAAFGIRIEQSAGQGDRDLFEIAIDVTRSKVRRCTSSQPEDLSDGSTVLSRRHRCTDFREKERAGSLINTYGAPDDASG